jgi:AcrR family transcriptional regulator
MAKEEGTTGKISTEEKIREAAAVVFIRKGYAATKTRDIAEEAGINIASLHYYYRSKDKLFELVMGTALRQFSQVMDSIFNNDNPLHEKIAYFLERYIDFLKENPNVPLFIIAESQQNPELVDKFMKGEETLDKLKSQLNDLASKGIIRKMHTAQFMLNLISLVVFPIISRPLLMHKLGLSKSDYDNLLEERKTLASEMIINYLYLKKPV